MEHLMLRRQANTTDLAAFAFAPLCAPLADGSHWRPPSWRPSTADPGAMLERDFFRVFGAGERKATLPRAAFPNARRLEELHFASCSFPHDDAVCPVCVAISILERGWKPPFEPFPPAVWRPIIYDQPNCGQAVATQVRAWEQEHRVVSVRLTQVACVLPLLAIIRRDHWELAARALDVPLETLSSEGVDALHARQRLAQMPLTKVRVCVDFSGVWNMSLPPFSFRYQSIHDAVDLA